MKMELRIAHSQLTNWVGFLEETMKLQVIFILIDIAILLAYPFVFVAGKVRQFLKIKG